MELFRLLGTIAVTNTEANEAIDETTQKAESSGTNLSGVLSKIGNVAVQILKVVVSAVVAATTAITGLAVSAVKSYADFEQLVGGVETLFGTGGMSLEEYAESVGKTVDEIKDEYNSMMNAQETVLANASEAYKTAGMSANEYMETVTSFSASLIQSLGGDTEKAAEYADMAIIDMSDNANKMGTDISMIQNAYQGFAKQNYTMLDNLKLGYGGCQEEMQRLLDDASKISGIEYDITSYADIVDAIHVVQEEMGIAGTTQAEATETISGSVSSLKAAWQNFLTGLADGDQDIGALADNLIDSFLIAFDNIAPRFVEALPRVIDGLGRLLSAACEQLPALIESVLPGAGELFDSEGLFGILIDDFKSIFSAVLSVGESLAPVFTKIGEAAIAILTPLAKLGDAILKPILDIIVAVVDKISVFLVPLMDTWTQMFQEFEEPLGKLTEFIQSSFDILGSVFTDNEDSINGFLDMLMGVFEYINGNLVTGAGVCADALSGIITFFQSLMTDNLDLIMQAFSGIGTALEGLVAFFSALFSGDFEGMIEAVKVIFDGLSVYFVNMFEGLKNYFTAIKEKLFSIMQNLWNSILNTAISIWEKIKTKVVEKFQNIKDKASEIFEGMKTAISGAFENMWTFVKGIINDMIGGAESMVNNIISAVNTLLSGISSVASTVGDLLGLDPISLQLEEVSLPRLEQGGILERGQVGLLEGNGAEAVVPLENNKKWISAVSDDMQEQGIGGGRETVSLLMKIIALLEELLDRNEALPEELTESISKLQFNINNREFARLVKGV